MNIESGSLAPSNTWRSESPFWAAPFIFYDRINITGLTFTFTFMHLADAFIQSDLQLHSGYTLIVSTCVPWELNPQPFALLTQCSTTEPHRNTEHRLHIWPDTGHAVPFKNTLYIDFNTQCMGYKK